MQESAAEQLSPRDARLEATAAIFRRGALINGVIALITLLLSGLAAARLLPFDALRSLLLFNYAGSADTA
ncbi:MAG: hypothetical protein IAE80_23435, partial [Anaerolinea sp.]|nr:hypothetical protein [Anaerolinea sp.]